MAPGVCPRQSIAAKETAEDVQHAGISGGLVSIAVCLAQWGHAKSTAQRFTSFLLWLS